MNFLKHFFLYKNKLLLVLPLVLFTVAFYIHYEMVMNSQIRLYQHTNIDVASKFLDDERKYYQENLAGSSLLYILQLLGTVLSLNIGLLYFGDKVSLKKIGETVIKSSIVLVVVHLATPLFLYISQDFYNFDDLYTIEANYSLARFVDVFANTGLKNLLEMFSVTQVVFVLFLALGLKYLMALNYKTALKKVVKIYGLAFAIWMIFSLLMDLNFYE